VLRLVHKHQGLSEQARQGFSEALSTRPEVVTAYVNRGYMLNDLTRRVRLRMTSKRH